MMQFAFEFVEEDWAVLPAVGDADRDDVWVAEQRAVAEAIDPARADEGEQRARAALFQRREGLHTSLYFRPAGLPGSGVLHFALADAIVEDEAFRAADWVPDGVAPQFEPVVSEFETDHSPHGYRVAYVSDAQAEDGSRLAGIVYGLRFDAGLGTVFSELADRDTTGLMQLHADPVVSSLRIVA